jgi:membrane protein
MLGKFAIGTYLGRYAVSSIYGAAGTLLLVLTWVYYSAIIFYLGAEFTKVYACTFGKKIE